MGRVEMCFVVRKVLVALRFLRLVVYLENEAWCVEDCGIPI